MLDTLQPIQPRGLRVSFDLETIAGEATEIQAEMALELRKLNESLPALETAAKAAEMAIEEYTQKTKKPLKKDTAVWEKQIQKYQDAVDSLKEKAEEFLKDAALKNSARIICMAFVAEKKGYVFTWLPLSEADLLTLFTAGIQVSVSQDETGMLSACMDWLDSLCIEILGGHNAYHFDMPKVRGRCARLNVHKADVFQPGTSARLVDTMYEYNRNYAMGERKYTSLDHMCAAFGLDGKPGKGSEVAEMYERKEFLTIIQYCVLDAVLVDQSMDKMEIFPTGGEIL